MLPRWSTGQSDPKYVMRLFNETLLAPLNKYGPRIGEYAMQGDAKAEAIIHRYRQFSITQDEDNYQRLCDQLKGWLKEKDL